MKNNFDFIDKVLEFNKISFKPIKCKKGEYIKHENDKCDSIGIIMSGNVNIESTSFNGKKVIIKQLEAGDVFGEILMFSEKNNYPADIISVSKAKVIFIRRGDFLQLLMNDGELIQGFLNHLANNYISLNERIKMISKRTIREKITNFLLVEYKKNLNDTIELTLSKNDLANYLGVERPSLVRELTKMKNEGLIDYDRNVIKIIDLDKLKLI